MKAWVIARNTFREIIRDRILYGIFIFGILFIFMSLLLGNLSFAETARIVTNLGLAAAQLTAVIVSIFVGSTLVSREIEKQTILTLLSRPLSRFTFLIGKFWGLTAVVVLSVALMSLILSGLLSFYGQTNWAIYWLASLGIVLECIVLVAFSVLFSSFARPALAVIFSVSIWITGHGVGDLEYFSSKSESPFIREGGHVLARLLPQLEAFNWRNQVTYNEFPQVHVVLQAVLLCVLWCVISLAIARFIFNRRDFV